MAECSHLVSFMEVVLDSYGEVVLCVDKVRLNVCQYGLLTLYLLPSLVWVVGVFVWRE